MTYGELAQKNRWWRSILVALAGTSFVGVMLSIVGFGARIAGFNISDAAMLRLCGLMMVSMCVIAPSAMLIERNARGAAAGKMHASHRRSELIVNTNVLVHVLHDELSAVDRCVIEFGWRERPLGCYASRGEMLLAALRAHISLPRAEAMIEAARVNQTLITCYFRLENEPFATCPKVFLIGQHILDAAARNVPVEHVHVPEHITLPEQYDFLEM